MHRSALARFSTLLPIAAVAALALAGPAAIGGAAIPTGHSAVSPPRSPGACDSPGSWTEARSTYARVFRLPHRSAVFACWYANGKVVRLTATHGEIGLYFHLSGRLVAFTVWHKGRAKDLRVFDLKKRKRVAHYPHDGESIEQLELTPKGAVAWIGRDPGTGIYFVRAAEDGRERLLDSGIDIQRRSLAVAAPPNESVIVYWLRGSEPRSARLAPPCDQCP